MYPVFIFADSLNLLVDFSVLFCRQFAPDQAIMMMSEEREKQGLGEINNM
jgi:hypothetical protein